MGPLTLIVECDDLVIAHWIGNSMIEIFKRGKNDKWKEKDLDTNRATKKGKCKQTNELKVCWSSENGYPYHPFLRTLGFDRDV